MIYFVYSLDTQWGDSNENTKYTFMLKNKIYIPIYDLVLSLTLISLNYPCLNHIFMVPKVFEPLKFYCICYDNGAMAISLSILICKGIQ